MGGGQLLIFVRLGQEKAYIRKALKHLKKFVEQGRIKSHRYFFWGVKLGKGGVCWGGGIQYCKSNFFVASVTNMDN